MIWRSCTLVQCIAVNVGFYSAVKEGAGNTVLVFSLQTDMLLQTNLLIVCQFYRLSEPVGSDLRLSDKIISVRIFASVKLLL
jgi:hypothetical protein